MKSESFEILVYASTDISANGSLQCPYKADRIAAVGPNSGPEHLNDQATQPPIQVAKSKVALQYCSLYL